MKIDFLQPQGIDNFSDFGLTFVTSINEYLDNAIEANAKNIVIFLKNNGDSTDVIIIDDGKGMDAKTLQYALSFGGQNSTIGFKKISDLGKFHSGMTVASLSLSNHINVYTNNGTGWVKNYLDKDNLKIDRTISPSEECDIPYEISTILKEAKREKGLDIELEHGTILILKNLKKEMIAPSNFKTEVTNIFNNICIRYHDYLATEGSIYIMVNTAEDIRKCESIHPLLKNTKLLKENDIEIFANFKYKNILTIKEVLPYSKLDGSMDVEFVLIRKINKTNRMLKAHDLVKLNMENQGSYFARNNLIVLKSQKIGFDKRHNSLNGVRTYSNLDGKWDTVLGININKSLCNLNSKFYELLNERLKQVYSYVRKALRGSENLNLPVIKLGDGRVCNPEIIMFVPPKNKSTTRAEGTPNLPSNNENMLNKPYIGIQKEILNTPYKNTVNTSSYPNDLIKNTTIKDFELIKPNTTIKSGDIPIIFAAKNKPDLKFNLGTGDINLSKDNENYYIYDDKISNLGVRKSEIEEWCIKNNISLDEFYNKTKNSIRKSAKEQIKFYDYYMKNIYNDPKRNFFLFPEVYLNINTKNGDLENKQCVDFLIILPNKEKIIIEIDGIGHYATKNNGNWYADSKKYSIDRMFDRKMQFEGYKVFRFSNHEISTDESILAQFFKNLFN